MQGEVYVPYSRIGGNNMDSGIMSMNFGGSSIPEAMPGEETGVLRLMWNYPGGISGVNFAEGGSWGYVLDESTVHAAPFNDDDIVKWLKGEYISQIEDGVPSKKYYDDNDIAAGDPGIITDINKMMRKYAARLINHGEIELFRESFPENYCWSTE